MSTFRTTSDQQKIEGHVAYGPPPLVPSGDVRTMIFDIHNFKNLPQKHDEFITTPTVSCHGYKWSLQVYPRGDEQSGTDTEYVSVFLELNENPDEVDVSAQFSFTCKCITEGILQHQYLRTTFMSFGLAKWRTRDWCIGHLLNSDGTLTIEVSLDLLVPKKKVWYPKVLHNIVILSDHFDDKTEADAFFLVDGSEFELHKLIIKKQAPVLYEMVEDFTGEGPIPIAAVDKHTFSIIEKFIYTTLDVNDVKVWKDMKTTKSIFTAADRFGCVALKLYAESLLTDKFLTPTTCGELLLLADSCSSPLLKEACQGVYMKDSADVLKSAGWKTMAVKSPDLVIEMLEYVSLGTFPVDANDIETWDVTMLRTKLQEADLDVDGTKSMLLKRWMDHTTLTQRKGNKHQRSSSPELRRSTRNRNNR